jgi:hypothetical protein
VSTTPRQARVEAAMWYWPAFFFVAIASGSDGLTATGG